jgi:hypothetical protein
MRKQVLWSVVAACLMAMAVVPAMADSRGSARSYPVDDGRTALPRRTASARAFARQPGRGLLVLKWKTPLAGFDQRLFVIERDGVTSVTGRLSPSGRPGFGLCPHSGGWRVGGDSICPPSMTCKPRHTVRYEAAISDFVRDDTRDSVGCSTPGIPDPRPDPLGQDLSSFRGRIALPAPRPDGRAHADLPQLLNGNIRSDRRSPPTPRRHATESYSTWSMPVASARGHTRFKTWFGAYTSSRYSTVRRTTGAASRTPSPARPSTRATARGTTLRVRLRQSAVPRTFAARS